ncbi:Cystatin [Parasponia andersonii]|uniref:Cysteine proteinase inhibitor n=1 Tax=Parasponia andersonii TaxID=3476 RepID=A0A2P5DLF5_PARAD|nr:Cystatin [Parasponia andersonii]
MEEIGRLRGVEGFEKDPKFIDLTCFTIDEHNKKKNEALKLVKVVNVNQQEVVSGMMYYIMMEALDEKAGQKFRYVASVLEKSSDNSKEAQNLVLLGEVQVL